MKCVVDIECNALRNPTQIWVIACKDLSAGITHVFRKVTSDEEEKERFLKFAEGVSVWIGHNLLGYDYPIIRDLLGFKIRDIGQSCIDTLIVSKLVNYSRPEGHSLESYGVTLNFPKGEFSDWSQYSKEMEDYCITDVDLCERVYRHFSSVIGDPAWRPALELEHNFQLLANSLHDNGFAFNSKKAEDLLEVVQKELSGLDLEITKAFPPKLKLIREITPTLTKHGTLHKKDFKWVKDGDLSVFNGGPFSLCEWKEFNPSSHKQIIEVLNEAGWKPVDKTKTHIDIEREFNRLKYQRNRSESLDLTIQELYSKLENQRLSGWKINDNNLETLPIDAPQAARTLAKRILYESRRRTLLEWLVLVKDGRIHGEFQGIGAWTHRMSHQNPNTANIPSEFEQDGSIKLLGKEMRSLWQAPRNRLLVGVDAEGIQLRIFAHYINDPEFIDSLVKGRKDDKTDPHSLNQRILGPVCKTRQAAKRFIYALLLGAGIRTLSEILGANKSETTEALDRLLERYSGFAKLRKEVIPRDAEQGYFLGLDNRKVPIPRKSVGDRKHLCMSGYLQNGEAVIMKKACLLWHDLIEDEFKFVNFVHDEWQTECKNNMEVAIRIAKIQADSLRIVGEQLKLHCPLAGSYWNEDHKDYTIGVNWYQTH